MAAENAVKTLLLTFYSKALESNSPKHQALVFAEVQSNIEELDLTGNLLKGLSNIIVIVSSHYNGKSRKIVRKFIKYIGKKCETTNLNFQEIFSAVCLKSVKVQENIAKGTSRSSLGLLKWSLLTGNNEWGRNFVELLSILTSQIRGRRYEHLAAKMLTSFCSSMKPGDFNALIACASTDEKCLVLLSYLARCSKSVRFEDPTRNTEIGTERGFREIMLKAKDIVIQKCLASKEQEMWSIEKISVELGQYLNFPDKSSIEQFFIPSFQKALLRSPETAIKGAAFLLENIGADLTECGFTLAKMLTPHLHSQSESIRHDAINACVALVKKLKSFDSLKYVLEWYISLFYGSEGKITVAAHKKSILKVFQDIKYFGVDMKDKETMYSLFEWVVEHLIKIIDFEVHEGTLVECFHCIYLWCNGLSTVKVSNAITKYIPRGFQNTKGLAKAAFYMVLASYSTTRRNHLGPFLPLIGHTLIKLSTNLNLTTLSEAIPLASIVTQSPIPEDDVLTAALSVLAGVNENNVALLSAETKMETIRLAKNILMTVNTKKDNIYKPIALVMASDNFEISNGITELASITSKANKVFPGIISELTKANAANLVSNQSCEKILLAMAKIQMTHSWMPLSSLRLAHQCSDKKLWEVLINKLHSLHNAKHKNIMTVCNELWDNVKPYIINFDNSLLSYRIVRTFSTYMGDEVAQCCVDLFKRLKSNGALWKVTRSEYFILHTPEGKLYDASVLDTDKIASKNQKRERKVYSYSEHLQETQRRVNEIEECKATGKFVQPSKQEEAMEAQLAKESTIRNAMKELDNQVVQCFGLFEVLLEANLKVFGHCLKDVIDELIGLMQSYIAAPRAVRLFENMGLSFFKKDAGFAYLVIHASLALISPKCGIEMKWDPRSLHKVLEKLKEMTFKGSDFSCACYTFCFPLLHMAAHKYAEDPSIIEAVLNITMNMIKLTNTSRHNPEQNSKFLPRIHLNRLLYHIMDSCKGHGHPLAHSAIVSLAEAAVKNDRGIKDTIQISAPEYVTHLTALKSHLKLVREAGLRSLVILLSDNEKAPSYEALEAVRANIFRLQFDSDPRVSKRAQDYVQENGFDKDDLYDELKICLMDPEEGVRVSSSEGIGEFVKMHPERCEGIVEDLLRIYQSHLISVSQILDDFGRVIEEGMDCWVQRNGAGLALKAISPYLSVSTAKRVMVWIVTRALMDKSQTVHNVILEAAVEIVKLYGKECLHSFQSIFETYLDGAGIGVTGDFENLGKACVVLLGCLARHLATSDIKVKSIFGKLIDTLSSSSEKVQQEVARCIPPLVPSIYDEKDLIIDGLFAKAMGASSYTERRGAAYGIAGMIKGLGIVSIPEYYVMDKIVAGMLDKGNNKHREGALMVLELLCAFLGRLVEPYVVNVVIYLLQCLGDTDMCVGEAAENTAQRFSKGLSGHGVTLVLPSLLTALDEGAWRMQCASLGLLGKLVECDIEKLSAHLPMIVSKLIEALGDSHDKVQNAATDTLKLLGSNIRNPEIQSIFPVILESLQNPGKKTSFCLQSLRKTNFFLLADAPSVALIIPVFERAFQDRSIENRKMAIEMTGKLYLVEDNLDLEPYIQTVISGLKNSILDPIPEIREIAAKALGKISTRMGKESHDELLPWLMKILTSEVNFAEKCGAAQGLAEVIDGSLSTSDFHLFMRKLISKANAENVAAHVLDGYMTLFIYMPAVFGELLHAYLTDIIKLILKELTDEIESVRETALKAMRSIVSVYSYSVISVFLPQLERGLLDDNWKMRFASVQLIGDCLYKLSGESVLMEPTESENDNFDIEESQKKLIKSLGLERRNRILACVFMKRSDDTLIVRQAADRVWKVVANSPKTLRGIMPTLFSLLLNNVSIHSPDKRQLAARTIKDLLKIVGVNFLPEIIPILEEGLDSKGADERQGVCIGLSEIINSTRYDIVKPLAAKIVPTIRKSLCHPDPAVRQSSTETFDTLYAKIGTGTMDEIIPFLIERLTDPVEGDYALDSLKQILSSRSKDVLPYLVPKLLAAPCNTKFIAMVASVAGKSLKKYLKRLVHPLVTALSESFGSPEETQIRSHCQTVVSSVVDDTCSFDEELLGLMESPDINIRRSAVTLISLYCIHIKCKHLLALKLSILIPLLADDNKDILRATIDALTVVVKDLEKDEYRTCILLVRSAIEKTKRNLKGKITLPGLCLPEGVISLWPVYYEALRDGNSELKEQAARGMSEIVVLSDSEALRPYAMYIIGPFIRILGERYGYKVDVAILETISVLLPKIGDQLKASLGPLQTTIWRCAKGPDRHVRLKAGAALAELVAIHSKPDSLFEELLNAIKQTTEVPVRNTMIFTLRNAIVIGGNRMNLPAIQSAERLLFQMLEAAAESTRMISAGCLGALMQWIPSEEIDGVLNRLYYDDDSHNPFRQAKTVALVIGLKESIEFIYEHERQSKIHVSIFKMLCSDEVSNVLNGIRACGYLFKHCILKNIALHTLLVQKLYQTFNMPCNDVKILMGMVTEVLGRSLYPKVISKELGKYLIPAMVKGTKGKDAKVQASCHAALIYILHLRDEGATSLNACLEFLDCDVKEDLLDLVNKKLQKISNSPEGDLPAIDCTILT